MLFRTPGLVARICILRVFRKNSYLRRVCRAVPGAGEMTATSAAVGGLSRKSQPSAMLRLESSEFFSARNPVLKLYMQSLAIRLGERRVRPRDHTASPSPIPGSPCLNSSWGLPKSWDLASAPPLRMNRIYGKTFKGLQTYSSPHKDLLYKLPVALCMAPVKAVTL